VPLGFSTRRRGSPIRRRPPFPGSLCTRQPRAPRDCRFVRASQDRLLESVGGVAVDHDDATASRASRRPPITAIAVLSPSRPLQTIANAKTCVMTRFWSTRVVLNGRCGSKVQLKQGDWRLCATATPLTPCLGTQLQFYGHAHLLSCRRGPALPRRQCRLGSRTAGPMDTFARVQPREPFSRLFLAGFYWGSRDACRNSTGKATSRRPPGGGQSRVDVVVRVWTSVPRFRRSLSGFIKGFRTLAQTRTKMTIGVDSTAPAHRPRWASLSEFGQASKIP
jgi:hypothetical protein